MNYEGEKIDLLFLDIKMKGKSGIEVLKELEHSEIIWKVVFVSKHQELVFDVFGIKTLGFVKKPARYEKIEKWLRILIKEQKENDFIECKGVNGKKCIKLENIYYLEANGNYVRLCGKEKKYLYLVI